MAGCYYIALVSNGGMKTPVGEMRVKQTAFKIKIFYKIIAKVSAHRNVFLNHDYFYEIKLHAKVHLTHTVTVNYNFLSHLKLNYSVFQKSVLKLYITIQHSINVPFCTQRQNDFTLISRLIKPIFICCTHTNKQLITYHRTNDTIHSKYI